MHKEWSWTGRLFQWANAALLSIVGLICLLPFLYVAVSSFSATDTIVPRGFSMTAYEYIFSTSTLTRSLLVSIYVTALGTLINLIFTSTLAYPLARNQTLGRRPILFLVLFTMLFNGGMIPTYFVVKWFGLINSLWSLMIPNAISAFNLIIMRNFFQQIPEELHDSAKMDGASDFRIFGSVILPLSLPALATFGLFYAVHHWNSYIHAILYLNDNAKWPIQVLLRNILILSNSGIGNASEFTDIEVPPQSIKMAVIIISTLPILCVYPFLQKHFAKGVLVGSVKG